MSNLQDFAKSANHVSILKEWKGKSPKDCGIDDETTIEKMELKNLLDQPIVILGYSERQGDTGPFYVVFAILTGSEKPCVFVTGASVIGKKLRATNEKALFPIAGKLVECHSDKFKYFDFV